MRHLLFNRNNPAPMTRWQQRRARVRRFWRDLWAEFSASVHGFRMLLGAEPIGALTLLGLILQAETEAFTDRTGSDQPAVAWVNFVIQLVIVIVAAVVAIAMAPKPPVPKPAALEDFDLPTAEEGRPLPVAFGTVWFKDPNVVWWGNLSTEAIKKKGGKK